MSLASPNCSLVAITRALCFSPGYVALVPPLSERSILVHVHGLLVDVSTGLRNENHFKHGTLTET